MFSLLWKVLEMKHTEDISGTRLTEKEEMFHLNAENKRLIKNIISTVKPWSCDELTHSGKNM